MHCSQTTFKYIAAAIHEPQYTRQIIVVQLPKLAVVGRIQLAEVPQFESFYMVPIETRMLTHGLLYMRTRSGLLQLLFLPFVAPFAYKVGKKVHETPQDPGMGCDSA